MVGKTKYFILGAVVVFTLLFVLLVVPDHKFLFQNSIGDCSGRTEFMYDVLYDRKTEADVVFFGSSRTMNAIVDTLHGKDKWLNLGYCRFGRNMDCFFIEEYLKAHHPSKIVLEVRETEGDQSHPLTPFLLPVSGISESFITLDFDVFSHLYNKWLCNLKYIRYKLFNRSGPVILSNPPSYGFWENFTKNNAIALNTRREADSLELLNTKAQNKDLNPNSTFYLNKIKSICDKKEIELCFLYLPCYGNVYEVSVHQASYSKYGKYILLDDAVFCSPANFADYYHVNKKGAIDLSLQLRRYLDPE